MIICTDKIKDQLGNVTAYKLVDTNKNVEKTIPAKVVEYAVASGKLKINGASVTDNGTVYIPARPSAMSLDDLLEVEEPKVANKQINTVQSEKLAREQRLIAGEREREREREREILIA